MKRSTETAHLKVYRQRSRIYTVLQAQENDFKTDVQLGL